MDNNEKSIDVKLKFIDQMGIYYESYGVPRIGGRILGLLLVSEKPVSAEQISEELKVSRGSISTNVRLLLTSGLIEKIAVPGDRVDYYNISKYAWDNAIKIRINGFMSLRNIITGTLSELNEDNANGKLKEMLDWTDLLLTGYEKSLEEWKKNK